MKREPSTVIASPQHHQRGLNLPRPTQVVMDTFSDLWIQHEDGRWRWVSLIGLLDQKPYRRLARPEIFRSGTLSSDRRWIEWTGSLRLHVDHLEGEPGKPTSKGVVVRAEENTTYGWYRPLWVWHAKEVRRQLLVGRPHPQHPDDVSTLRWLGWSEAALTNIFGAYPAATDAVAARLLDLVLYLGVLSPVEATELRHWLTRPWIYPGYAMPWEAIEAGDIALVERMYVTESTQKRNFTTYGR